jgi:hypothetical protein
VLAATDLTLNKLIAVPIVSVMVLALLWSLDTKIDLTIAVALLATDADCCVAVYMSVASVVVRSTFAFLYVLAISLKTTLVLVFRVGDRGEIGYLFD